MTTHLALKLVCFAVLIGLAFLDAHEKRQITTRFIFIQIGIALVAIWLVFSN
jgi:nucleoside permease NupC